MTPEQQTTAYLKCQDAIECLENENMAMREAIKEATPLLDKVHCELGATNEHLINRIAEGEAVTTWQRDVEESLITLRAALAKLQPFTTP